MADLTLLARLKRAETRITDLYKKLKALTAQVNEGGGSGSTAPDAAIQVTQSGVAVPTVAHTFYNNTGGTFTLFRTAVGKYRITNSADTNGNRNAIFQLTQRGNDTDDIYVIMPLQVGPQGYVLSIKNGTSGDLVDLSSVPSGAIEVFWRNNNS